MKYYKLIDVVDWFTKNCPDLIGHLPTFDLVSDKELLVILSNLGMSELEDAIDPVYPQEPLVDKIIDMMKRRNAGQFDFGESFAYMQVLYLFGLTHDEILNKLNDQ